ncbi:MAG TPA: YgiQ family radical SAM protein [Anaerolineales bacterium]|nr:YgiQ family radical SAM protein [Anaerolineales bacterium]
MFLPTTRKEVVDRGWDSLDVILVSGDSYIDSPYIGTAVIGKHLERHGFKVGIIAQPDTNNMDDIGRLGEPGLFWGVTAGCVDSMVANYTALKKKRRTDDYTPGGVNNRRPDRASIVYTNLIRRYTNTLHINTKTKPIVLGGIEASLRRIAHYDYWSNRIRRSILFDAKADYLLYGMAEAATLEFAFLMKSQQDPRSVKGLCYISKGKPDGYLEIPSFESVDNDNDTFTDMFHLFYKNNDPKTARGLIQAHGDRYLVQNPPHEYATQVELDDIYSLNFEYEQHPYYEKMGKVKALDTIKFSISTHRGCYGECNFCAIAVHEGRTIRWRSENSIIKEAKILTKLDGFKGYIHDVGGPTANMFGYECKKKLKSGSCEDRRCLFPEICPALKADHSPYTNLLVELRKLNGIKKIFVGSGIRYDLLASDNLHGEDLIKEISNHHVSGQLKIAPEHIQDFVLEKMGKTNHENLLWFKQEFDDFSRAAGKKQFLTYYFIAAHPGCTVNDMQKLRNFSDSTLKIHPEQVQIFTPTPSTYSTLMYYTEKDPFTGEALFVEKDPKHKQEQKNILVEKNV